MQYAMLGTTEVVVIVLVVLVLFGAKKIPEFAKGLGKGLKEFKDAKNDIKERPLTSTTAMWYATNLNSSFEGYCKKFEAVKKKWYVNFRDR